MVFSTCTSLIFRARSTKSIPCIWVCLKIVYPKKTQWFCWSLSLWKMAISLGVYPIFRHTHLAASSHFFGSHTNHLGKKSDELLRSERPLANLRVVPRTTIVRNIYWIYWIHVKSWYQIQHLDFTLFGGFYSCWKMMEWKSMGRMTTHIWNGKLKIIKTTKQLQI